jgi:hypothetical protein
MTRDASDCLLCHLTGLFGDQRQKAYDEWLLNEIEQAKGSAYPAEHFSHLHTGLNISVTWQVKENWQSFNELRSYFDVLQISVPTIEDNRLTDFLLWNQKLSKPFHIFAVLSTPSVRDASVITFQESYDRLRQVIELVFLACKLPLDGISFEHVDYLWKESSDPQRIEPRNHYLLRHIRSAMDRIGAQQALFVHSQGRFMDVNDYFSDGNNEIQLAGSTELTSTLIKSLIEGNSNTLAGITSQFHLNSLETAYFHTLSNINHLDKKQRELAQWLLLVLTGIPTLDFESFALTSLEKMLNLRMNHDALYVHGVQIQLGAHEQIWAGQRYSMDMSRSLLCLANLSDEEQRIALGEDDLFPDEHWKDVFTENEFIAGQQWTLNPYQVLVLI